jgi:hypothetical protein
MNKKFALTLLSSPVLFASMLSMLMIAHPARANQTVNSSEARLPASEIPTQYPLVLDVHR